ncbi:MAG TPA: leucine-rich repeat domain-containing protein [Candidatus Saccharimonadales bacterium]|nr:leucine-rich repeat domain-containing protein [Candidatus Saccharimonadales bacterium]
MDINHMNRSQLLREIQYHDPYQTLTQKQISIQLGNNIRSFRHELYNLLNRQTYHHIQLSDDIYNEILLHANLPDIFKLCQVNKSLCSKKEHVFQQLFYQWFGECGLYKTTTWFHLFVHAYRLTLLQSFLNQYLINKSLLELQSLQELSLSSYQISVIPPEIGQLQSLQNLTLSNNQLLVIPPEIGQLHSLQELYLSNNHLRMITPEIGQLQSLQKLSLAYNQIRIIPPEIGRLQSLQILYLYSNQISVIPPEISQLQSLQKLYLNNNQISIIPPEIGQLQSLQILSLYNNQIRVIPPEIGQLQSLQQLYLTSNQISDIPPEISQLQSLLLLTLVNNPLNPQIKTIIKTWFKIHVKINL